MLFEDPDVTNVITEARKVQKFKVREQVLENGVILKDCFKRTLSLVTEGF